MPRNRSEKEGSADIFLRASRAWCAVQTGDVDMATMGRYSDIIVNEMTMDEFEHWLNMSSNDRRAMGDEYHAQS